MATKRPRLTTLKSSLATVPSRLQTMTPGSWRSGKTGSTARGYGYKWQQAREEHLRLHPLCVMCEAQGRVTVATIVDHRTAHRGDQTLFWDRGNWQSLCKPHHDEKTQYETAALR